MYVCIYNSSCQKCKKGETVLHNVISEGWPSARPTPNGRILLSKNKVISNYKTKAKKSALSGRRLDIFDLSYNLNDKIL